MKASNPAATDGAVGEGEASLEDAWLDDLLVTEEVDFDIEQVLLTDEVPAHIAARLAASDKAALEPVSGPPAGNTRSHLADATADPGEDEAPRPGIRGRLARWVARIFGG